MRIKNFLLICGVSFLFNPSDLLAQQVLSDYIETGLNANLEVQRLTQDYDRTIWALKESKRLFGPTLDVVANHKINFRQPVDVSSSKIPSSFLDFLEQMQTGNVKNGKLYFPARNQFSDGLQINQNILNRSLDYQVAIRKEESQVVNAKITDFTIELEAAISSAYFQYLLALEELKIHQENLKLNEQQLAITEQLLAQNKVTRDAKYRAILNKEKAQANLNTINKNIETATSYFNFLLNRPLDMSIEIDKDLLATPNAKYSLTLADQDFAFTYKTDVINHQRQLSTLQKQQISAQAIPVIQLSAMGGIQAMNYNFDSGRLPFFTGGISMKWNLFNNGVRNAKYQQAKINAQRLDTEALQLEKQFEQQRTSANTQITMQLLNHQAIYAAKINGDKYLDAVQQKYKEGLSTVVELYDAQEQKLQTTLNELVWYYDLQQMLVDYNKIAIHKTKLIK